MKKVMRVAVLLLVAVVISAPIEVSATIISGNGSLISWLPGSLNRNYYTYFDGPSSDSPYSGVGFWLTNTGYFSGSTAGPGYLSFYGTGLGQNGDASLITFSSNGQETAAIKIEISDYSTSNTFGYYYLSNPTQRYQLFSGNGSTVAFFTPTEAYGYYFRVVGTGQIYYTNSSLNTVDVNNQHFAAFMSSLTPSTFYLGMEDLTGGDYDYNDMIVKITSTGTSVPEPGTMLLLGFGLLGTAALRLRRRD